MAGESATVAILTPPLGITQNFINPKSQASECIVVCSIALALAIVFVALRSYAKIGVLRTAGWDDREFFAC